MLKQTPNKKQKEAITHPPAPLMILAGAGTGKTFTLESRIIYMIKKFLLTLISIVFISTNAFSNSCPVLYPELLEMWKNSTLAQDKKDAAKALIDKGWAMHQEVEFQKLY